MHQREVEEEAKRGTGTIHDEGKKSTAHLAVRFICCRDLI